MCFLAQWISVGTEPSAFVREHIRLGNTTNFLRAISFFFFAVSTAFLAEVATLYLLGIGGAAEPPQTTPKVLNPTEGAHIRNMSIFEADEHLRATPSPNAEVACARRQPKVKLTRMSDLDQ